MAFGLPKIFSKIFDLFRDTYFEIYLVRGYYRYLKLYSRLDSLFKVSLFEPANINPVKLYYVDPDKINYEMSNSRSLPRYFFRSRVVDGNWDKESIRPIERQMLFNAIKDYHNTCNFNSYSLSESEREALENLYSLIKETGYKKQSELEPGKNTVREVDRVDYFLDEFNEVTLNIGRNGEFILETGHHRTYIAKVLNLDKIPCRISVRHRKWQNKRNSFLKEDQFSDNISHVDIKSLSNQKS